MHVRVSVAALAAGAAAALLAGCGAGGARPEAADLVLRGGRIVTMDSVVPEAEALAVTGSRIVAVGTDAEIGAYIGDGTEVVELGGRLAIPGFIEGHGHYMGLGEARLNLDLMSVRNWDEIVALVAAATRDAGTDTWIIGRGWHQEKWDRVPEPNVEGVPLHAALDAVSPANPVYLTHASGHAALVNGRALALAGIDRNTPDPAGGEIVRDARGEPTGLLRETAQRLVSAALARADSGRSADAKEALLRRQVQLAGEEALANGVTSFVDAGVGFETVDFYRRLEAEGTLPVRLYVMIRAPTPRLAEDLARYRAVADTNDFLVVRSIKRSLDGALGSHGAWLLAPYADLRASVGLATDDTADLKRVAALAAETGYQLGIHAIGDRANREVLNLYEATFRAHPELTDPRWRIEHAQHLDPADVPRFAELGVVAAMQGVHATSDGPWVLKRLGEKRAESGAYVWQDLLRSGVVIANGTDAPVEDIDPIASFYASVTRRMGDGQAFYPAQRMTREQALRSYTIDNARATFAEAATGSLAVGKLADIVVLSQDLLAVPDEQLRSTRVDLTILGGEVKYRRAPATAAR
jgi:predicted amidohydrolase YtcJ